MKTLRLLVLFFFGPAVQLRTGMPPVSLSPRFKGQNSYRKISKVVQSQVWGFAREYNYGTPLTFGKTLMRMLAKIYYKNKLMLKLIKPLENRRLFTALKLNILTLKHYGYWPKQLIALDAFCQTGLQWTRIFSEEADYLEMWDIDPEAIKFAKREFPKASVNCGDSIAAIMHGKLNRRDFNFVLIDSPLPYMYPDGSFEHFKFFTSLFGNIAQEAVIMLDVVADIQTMLDIHPLPVDLKNKWKQARADFYGVESGAIVLPSLMIDIYKMKVRAAGFEPKLVTYHARNAYFGMLTLVVSKKG